MTKRASSIRKRLSQEHGAALVVAAIVLLLVFALVALALDGGRGLDEHRSVQNSADHAAIAAAWAKCHGDDPIAAGEAFALANGYSPSELLLNPNYGPNSVEAVIATSIDGQVSPVIGVDQIDVADRAVATCYLQPGGGGDLPFGAPGGGVFDGSMQVGNPCSSGNCRPLSIPRTDVNGTGNIIIRNISLGIEPELVVHWDNPSGTYSVCQAGEANCHILDTDTGVSAAHLSDGMARGSNAAAVDGRLETLGPAIALPPGLPTGTFFTPKNRELDGNHWWHILEGTPNPPGVYPNQSTTIVGLDAIRTAICDGAIPEPAPQAGGRLTAAPCSTNQANWQSPWIDAVHGDFWTVPDSPNHVYYDGLVHKCDSPRLAQMPVVTDELGFYPTVGVLPPLDPNGKKEVKILGFLDVLVHNPYVATDFNNADVIKTTSAYIIWYGPNATCANGWPVGEPVPDTYIVTLDE